MALSYSETEARMADIYESLTEAQTKMDALMREYPERGYGSIGGGLDKTARKIRDARGDAWRLSRPGKLGSAVQTIRG